MQIDRFAVTAGAALVALLGLATVAPAASINEFGGTRAEVRESCVGEGRHLIEGLAYSLCVTATSDVLCNDDGLCASSDLRVAMAEGFRNDRLVAANP